MLIFGGEATRIGQKRYDRGNLQRYFKTLRTAILYSVLIGAVLLAPGCGNSHALTKPLPPPAPPMPPMSLVVNSLEDSASPPLGVATIRSAIAEIRAGGTVTFDAGLNGRTILLSIGGVPSFLWDFPEEIRMLLDSGEGGDQRSMLINHSQNGIFNLIAL